MHATHVFGGSHVAVGAKRAATCERYVQRGRIEESLTYLDNSADGASSGLENVLHALAADGRFLRNGALDEVPLSIGRNLARNEDVRACDYGLGLSCDQESVLHHYYRFARNSAREPVWKRAL